MRLLLITPPMTQLNTPYPATAYLTGCLRKHVAGAVEIAQADLSIELFLRLFSREGLTAVQAELAAAARDEMKKAGVGQFGSGYAWLAHNGSGLEVFSTPNQDNPVLQGKAPILGIDVWEHAYYLKYQNKRPDYIDAWWNTVDWGKVAERFSAAG